MTRHPIEQLSLPSAAPASNESPRTVYSQGLGMAVRLSGLDMDHRQAKQALLTIIKANLLIPGDGEPTKDAALVIKDKLIEWVGPQSSLPTEYTEAKHRSFSVPYLMPGLWDCHVHFGGEAPDPETSPAPFVTDHPACCGARLTKGCWESLQRGYTSVRDVAGYGNEVGQAIEEGSIVGPNVYSSGAALSQTAGHGDAFNLPAGVVLSNLGVANILPGHFGAGVSCVVDGVDECRRAVRLQIRRGAKVIKVCASGGVLSRDDNVLYAQFSKEELACIVDEASRQHRAVAAHVHGKPGILAAIEAGVTTVEHVTFADQECIDLIKEKDIVYVATRTVLKLLEESEGQGVSKPVWEKAKLVMAHSLEAYKLAIQNGLTFALGTDTGPGFNQARELEYAVEAGMSNLEAIKAATANGPLTVGDQAPKTGQLKAGYEADVLGLLDNPVSDVRILQNKKNIGWVWKGGKIFKGPGVGPWGEDEE